MTDVIKTFPGLVAEKKFTQPPPRYSIASLGKKCEDEQIARPATFSGFLDTLQHRGYIRKHNKSFQATELGIEVIDFLVESEFCFVDIKFTSGMEDLLDRVQNNTKDKVELLSEFWTRLKKDIESGKSIKQQKEITNFVCPLCNGKLLLKTSKFGKFFSCENYKSPKKNESSSEKSCSYTASMGADGLPAEKKTKVKEYMDFKCVKCGSKMVKRTSKYGDFAGCDNFPKCKSIADLQGNFQEQKKYSKKKKKKNNNSSKN